MTPSDIKHTAILVPDLCCAAEELTVRRRFREIPRVHDLQVNFVTHRLVVHHSASEQELLLALREIGMPGTIETARRTHRLQSTMRLQAVRLGASVFLLALAFAAAAASFPPIVSTVFTLSAIVAGGTEIATKAWRAILNRSLDINVLMTIAVIGAVVLSDYAEGAAVIVLFGFSLFLESVSMERTHAAIGLLLNLSPPTAHRIDSAGEREVPTEELRPGHVVRVKPGERIPVDGVVASGTSSVDQSPLTGESVPSPKVPGDMVFAGTYNHRGVIDIRVERATADSRLTQIVHLVEDAESRRASRQSVIDSFARLYTPAVFILAVTVAAVPPIAFHEAFGEWLYRALVLLVISCPCALVISTPVTLVSALTNAARHGLLIKGGKHLETLATVRALAVDKTGTLTSGSLQVTGVFPLNSMTEEEILTIAAGLESHSEHHLAEAFLRKAAETGTACADVTPVDFEAVHGRGIRATVKGTRYSLGNHQLVHELGVCSPGVERRLSELEEAGHTVVILADETRALGIITVRDTIRLESRAAVAHFHRLGIRPVVLLTGDNERTARAVASELGVDEVHASLLPDQKLHAIESLRSLYGSVGMIGDGINDAPALAAADIGIAMGAIGSDSAIETADIVLMSDNLAKIPHGVALGRRALRLIKQNIALALAVKTIFLLLGVLGLTSLWLAIMADDGVTLAVVLNSMRALRFRSL